MSIKAHCTPQVPEDETNEALNHQHSCFRYAPLGEFNTWDKNELSDFIVEDKKLDHVYEQKVYKDDAYGEYYLVTRMQYKDTRVFIEFGYRHAKLEE